MDGNGTSVHEIRGVNMGVIAGLTIAAVTAATSIGTTLAGVFSKPKAPAAPAPATTNLQTAQATEAAAQAQATALTQRRGMASTILTSPLGVTGDTPTLKSTLGA